MTESTQNQLKKDCFHAQVAGMNLKLKSSSDEELVYESVQYVNQKFKEALSSMKSGSFQMAAILTALNIAEEYLFLRKHRLSDLNCIEDKAKKILTALEASQKKYKFKKESRYKDITNE